jgi:uncharacterized OsmC-like protein
MANVRARVFEYAVSSDPAGGFALAGGETLVPGPVWTPEDLVLAGLVQCSLASLAYHAKARKVEAHATASATGTVTRREDGRYAFVAISLRIDARIVPPLAGDELAGLLERAERDCFVGASLSVKPAYTWLIDGIAH